MVPVLCLRKVQERQIRKKYNSPMSYNFHVIRWVFVAYLHLGAEGSIIW